jgi:hypothetical protein
MIGLPSGLTFFDFGFILIFGIEDLFFFFWSSRPIIAVSDRGELVADDVLLFPWSQFFAENSCIGGKIT